MNKHRPDCSINKVCLVFHENGVCPDSGKCDCHTPQEDMREKVGWEEFENKFSVMLNFIEAQTGVSERENLKSFITEQIQKVRENMKETARQEYNRGYSDGMNKERERILGIFNTEIEWIKNHGELTPCGVKTLKVLEEIRDDLKDKIKE